MAFSKCPAGYACPFSSSSDCEAECRCSQGRSSEKGISVVITEGFRSFKEQDELYKQGRTKKGNIVTYARGGESYHNYGLAVDFALQKKDGSIIWDMEYDGNQNGKSDWLEVVEIAKKLGFKWGGDWNRFKDYPHLEMIPD